MSPRDEEPTERRFERAAALDRWVHDRSDALQSAYETSDDGRTMLAVAASDWVREDPDTPDVDRAVAAIATAVAAGVETNLEPACSRLVWATHRRSQREEPLSAAEHYAVLGLAAARRPSEREAAECVWEAIRFVSGDGAEREASLARFAELADRRLANLGAVVGAYLPFWSFPFAFRWDREAPPFGRGSHGVPEPIDDERVDGWLTLGYRMGKRRDEIADLLERCAWRARRLDAPDRLSHARATAALAELAEALAMRWSVPEASSPRDVVTRLAPHAISRSFGAVDRDGSLRPRTMSLLRPILAGAWPDVAEVGRAHDAWRRSHPRHAIAA